MKLIIIASLIACSFAAKLDRTYLPPPGAQTSGGSPGSLEAPFGSPGPSNFGQSPNFGSNNQGPFRGQEAPQGSNLPAFGSNQGARSQAQGGNQFQTPAQPALEGPQGFDQNAGGKGDFAPQQGFGAESQRPQAEADRSAEILRYTNENDGETFEYSFETSNGISAEESGVATNGVQAQGAFAYTGDDGQMYSVTYTADENGYLPKGDHLPTPPPIPEEILRSIEKNAQAAAAGTQEGAYNPDEDVSSPQQYNAPNAAQQPSGPSQQYGAPTGPSNANSPMNSFDAPTNAFNAPASNQRSQTNYNAGPSSNNAARFTPSSPSGPATTRFTPSSPPSGPTGPAQSSPAQSGFAPSTSSTFGPSRPAQGAPTLSPQYRPQQTPGFRQQNTIPVQAQDESGYRYNQPQNGGPQGFGAAQPSNGFGASTSNNGVPRPSVNGRLASNNGFQAERPSAPVSNNAQSSQYNVGRNNQRPSAPNSNNAEPNQYNAPNNAFQPAKPTPVAYVQPTQYNAGSNAPRPFSPNAGSNIQSARPAARMPEYQSAPYQYNPPRSQGQQRPQQNGNPGSGPFNPLGDQTFNQGSQNVPTQYQPNRSNQVASNQRSQNQGPQNQGRQNQARQNQSRPSGQDFRGPLQQQSFSPEEGYKY